MERKRCNAYLLALEAMVRMDDLGLVPMISASTWPEMKPVLWIWEEKGKRGCR